MTADVQRVEAMARALWEADHDRTAWEDATEDGPDEYRRRSATAISAMPSVDTETLRLDSPGDLRPGDVVQAVEWDDGTEYTLTVARAALASPASAPQKGNGHDCSLIHPGTVCSAGGGVR